MNDTPKTQELEQTPQEAAQAAAALLPPDVKAQAQMLIASKVFPSMKSVGAAVVAIELGHGLGLAPAQAMAGISIVEGRPFIGANILARAVKLNPKYDYRVTTHTTDECTIAFFEFMPDGTREEVGVSTYTIVEATEAGAKFESSTGAAMPWKKFPKNMLFARALSNGVKWFCPDAVGTTVYVNEERDLLPPVTAEAVEPEPPERIERARAEQLAKLAEESSLSTERIETLCHAYGLPESDDLVERLGGLTVDDAGRFASEIGAAAFNEPVQEAEIAEEEPVSA